MNKNTFKAQALAIVMVVLVVASIIGVSLFSRVSKDKDASINEQDSAISSSLVDAVLDFFVGADIAAIEAAIGEEEVIGVTDVEDLSEVITFLQNNDIAENIALISEGEWCTGESKTSLSISYEDEEDFIEVQPGSVRAYNLEGATFDPPAAACPLTVRMRPVEDVSIFVVKKVMNDGTDITEEMSNYCIGSEDACENVADVEYENEEGSFTIVGESLTFELMSEMANNVVEIRILPIKGVLAISTEVGECISKQLKSIKITAEANCNNSYRGKQMFTPGSGNLGYSTLFDYGIYDMGLFQP
jgi:hypothetical protein